MAAFQYFQYNSTTGGGNDGNLTSLVSGTAVTVTDNDAGASGSLAEVGDVVVIGGINFTITGIITGGAGGHAGDFYATNPGGTQFYFSSSNALTTGNGSQGDNPKTDGGFTFSTSGSVSFTCFLPGTLIATERGAVAIEDLVIGDRLLTADGSVSAVRWVTKQTVATAFSPRVTTYPVCISAGALGDGLPRRDLFVSPAHAMYVDGRLVMASALINGSSIYQVAQMPARFEYLHVETEGHRVIFAEGAATKSYIDKSPRQNFDNWADYVATYPDWQPIEQMDVPVVEARRLLPDATKQRLEAVAVELGYAEKDAA